MRILDTDAINVILAKGIVPSGECYVTPDVEQEMSIAEVVTNKKVPSVIKSISHRDEFDEAIYLKNYYDVLNQYVKRSFFNMKGFGDVSIIAAVRALIQARNARTAQLSLPGFDDLIEVYTGDGTLVTELKSQCDDRVKVFSKSDVVRLQAYT